MYFFPPRAISGAAVTELIMSLATPVLFTLQIQSLKVRKEHFRSEFVQKCFSSGREITADEAERVKSFKLNLKHIEFDIKSFNFSETSCK